jgi:hypothetical protein
MRKAVIITFCIVLIFSSAVSVKAETKKPWDLARDKADSFSPQLYMNTTFFYEAENNPSSVFNEALEILRPDSLSLRKDTSVVEILQDEELGEITVDAKLVHTGYVEGDVELYHKLSLDGSDGEEYSFYRFEYTTDLNASLLDWIAEAKGLANTTQIHNFTIDKITMRWIYEYEAGGNIDILIKRPEVKVMKIQLGTNLYNVPVLKTGRNEYSEMNIYSYVVGATISNNTDVVVYTGNEYYRPTIYVLSAVVLLSLAAIVLVSIAFYKKRGRFRR